MPAGCKVCSARLHININYKEVIVTDTAMLGIQEVTLLGERHETPACSAKKPVLRCVKPGKVG